MIKWKMYIAMTHWGDSLGHSGHKNYWKIKILSVSITDETAYSNAVKSVGKH